MFPLRIDIDHLRRPWATLGVACACGLAFVLTADLAARDLAPWALDPGRFAPWQLLTAAFLHADAAHLAANLVFLLVFGRYVEDRVGPARFLVLYLAFALAGSATFLVVSWLRGVAVPGLGASGAVAGTMGFVLALAPKSRITLLWFPDRQGELPRAPAWIYLVLWFLLQLPMVLAGPVAGLVALVHLAGLLAGVAAVFLLRSRALEGTPWHLEGELEGGDPKAARRRRAASLYGQIAAYHREKRGGAPIAYTAPLERPEPARSTAPPRAPAPGPHVAPRPLAEEPEPEPLPPREGEWTVGEGVRALVLTLAWRLLFAFPLAVVVYGFVLAPLLALPRSGILAAVFGIPLGMGIGALVARQATGTSGFVGWLPASMAALAASIAMALGYVTGTAIVPIPEAAAGALALTVTGIGAAAAIYYFLVLDA